MSKRPVQDEKKLRGLLQYRSEFQQNPARACFLLPTPHFYNGRYSYKLTSAFPLHVSHPAHTHQEKSSIASMTRIRYRAARIAQGTPARSLACQPAPVRLGLGLGPLVRGEDSAMEPHAALLFGPPRFLQYMPPTPKDHPPHHPSSATGVVHHRISHRYLESASQYAFLFYFSHCYSHFTPRRNAWRHQGCDFTGKWWVVHSRSR